MIDFMIFTARERVIIVMALIFVAGCAIMAGAILYALVRDAILSWRAHEDDEQPFELFE